MFPLIFSFKINLGTAHVPSPVEYDALPGEPLQHGRPALLVVPGDVTPPQVVRQDVQDVGPTSNMGEEGEEEEEEGKREHVQHFAIPPALDGRERLVSSTTDRLVSPRTGLGHLLGPALGIALGRPS